LAKACGIRESENIQSICVIGFVVEELNLIRISKLIKKMLFPSLGGYMLNKKGSYVTF